MTHFLKCTDKQGKEVFINFDYVYQMKRLTEQEATELSLMDPTRPRTILVADPPGSLDKQLRG
jgi:hypothetical protein